MTLKEIAEVIKIDLKALYEKLEISKDVPENTKFREFKNYMPDFTD